MRAKYYAGHTTPFLYAVCARLVLCITGVLELDLTCVLNSVRRGLRLKPRCALGGLWSLGVPSIPRQGAEFAGEWSPSSGRRV
jgi:hypothetical protein